MTVEENIKQQLMQKFNYPEDKVIVKRPRRIYLSVGPESFREVLDYAVKGLKFGHLCTITGLDKGDNIGLIYHLMQDSGIILNLKTNTPKSNPVIKSIIDYFSSAENYERELVDLLGVKVEDLPPGFRYPLVDDWPADQFPLRKDWKPSQEGKS